MGVRGMGVTTATKWRVAGWALGILKRVAAGAR